MRERNSGLDRQDGQARRWLAGAAGAWRLVWLALALVALAPTAGRAAYKGEFTTDFRIADCTWSSQGRQNPYFSLRPGRQLVLEGEDEGELIRAEITVLDEVETISFVTAAGAPLTVTARVVEEREFVDGQLKEVSINWYARCVETSDIYYFGEEVDIYEDGVLVSHDGAWRAGEDGAQPGIMMPGTFLLGARYYNEVAPGVALDRSENSRTGLTISVPAGTFGNCVQVDETNPLSDNPKAADIKRYCPKVGIVHDGVLELVEQGLVP